ncbi:MAG: hypothetical protein FWD47_12655 [Treponema sp.]|nr:hypothetical protein [Treponema sp.]
MVNKGIESIEVAENDPSLNHVFDPLSHDNFDPFGWHDIPEKNNKKDDNVSDKELKEYHAKCLAKEKARKKALKANPVDWVAEKEAYLAYIEKAKSPNTYKAYAAALGRLEKWAKHNIVDGDVLYFLPEYANSFIIDLEKWYLIYGNPKKNSGHNWLTSLIAKRKRQQYLDGRRKRLTAREKQRLAERERYLAESISVRMRSAASVRLDISALNFFYDWFHCRHAFIENPFSGIARPPKEVVIKRVNLDKRVIEDMIEELPAYEAAAIAIMAFHGLKIGALPSFTVDGDQFKYISKGKDVTGKIHPTVLKAIVNAELPMSEPFAGMKSNTIGQSVDRTVRVYCHGRGYNYCGSGIFRNSFAKTEWEKDKNVYRLSKLFNHATVQVTKDYLRGLGVDIDGLTNKETEYEKFIREFMERSEI